jgi:lysophospholipase L1-like esterase
MSTNSTKQSTRQLRPLHRVVLSIFISLIAVGGTVGGFLIGRNSNQNAYVKKVSAILATENNILTLDQALGEGIDDPLTAQAMARLYNVPAGDQAAIVRRLSEVVWLPPYRPAPFVGHMARPILGDDPHINVLGFRDERQSYLTKADRTVRVFMTGGSTAWGSGASSQRNTISYLLEEILNERGSRTTGYRYEIVNAAFPGWSTTQEKLLIQQRLIDMHPDVVLMFSGNNDIHWARDGRDIRWFYSPMDQNYMLMLNELYTSSGHPEWSLALPASSRPVTCSDLARITTRNVEEAAIAAARVKARMIFALQPNVATTAKQLTRHEQRLPEVQNKPYWDSCYEVLRQELSRISAPNYRLIDLSRSFVGVDGNTEVFVDSYHFADLGNRLIAQALADEIDWLSIIPGSAVIGDGKEPLKIISFDPTESSADKPLNLRSDRTAAMRVVPNRINKNLLVVFDESVLATVIADDAITAAIPASHFALKGEHRIYIVDSMTGETSPPVVFHAR